MADRTITALCRWSAASVEGVAGLPKYLSDKPLIGTHMLPAALAGGYIVGCEGDCLAPAIQEEDAAVIHPRVTPREGMIVAVLFRDGRQPVIKRLASDLPEPDAIALACGWSIVLEMDNPRSQFCVSWAAIDRVHVVMGIIRGGSYIPFVPEREVQEAQVEAHLDAASDIIATLDATDGDPDLCASEHDGLEPDSDEEPSLGWTTNTNQTKALRTCHGWQAREDFEQEHDGREPDVDGEPSLGASNPAFFIGGLDQTRWGHGAADDREQDWEDEGACETALAVL